MAARYFVVLDTYLVFRSKQKLPFARCATRVNVVCSNTDIFRRPITSLKQILP